MIHSLLAIALLIGLLFGFIMGRYICWRQGYDQGQRDAYLDTQHRLRMQLAAIERS